MVLLSLADLDNFNEKSTIFENKFCIYRFEHKNRETKALMPQIAVDKITKCQICEKTEKKLFRIQLCPRKGAKATDALE